MSPEESKKQLQRFAKLTAVVAAVSAMAFILAANLGDKPENDAAKTSVEEQE